MMRVTSVHKRKVARRRSSHAQTDSTEEQQSRAYGRTYPSMLRHASGQSGATPRSAWTTSCTWPSFWLLMARPRPSLVAARPRPSSLRLTCCSRLTLLLYRIPTTVFHV